MRPRLMALLVAAAGALSCVVAVLYSQERGHELSLLQQQGRQRIDKESEFLNSAVDSVRSDVLYLSEQALLRRFLTRRGEARQELEQEYVRFATRKTVYDQIRVLDTGGKEIIRVNHHQGRARIVTEEELQPKADRYYYRDAMKLNSGEVFVSEFDLNVEHGQIERPLRPVIRFLTRVADDTGRTRGLMALNYSGQHLLRGLNETSVPGSTLLVNAAGQYIRGPRAEDAWGWMLGHGASFTRHFPKAWQQTIGQPAGQFSTSEGMFTFRRISFSTAAGTEPVHTGNGEAGGLMLVVHVPPDLQFRSSSKLLAQLMWLYAGAMMLVAVIGWYWARSAAIRQQQSESIRESERRLRTLSSQLLTAQEAERRSISRQLHDELGQQITAISLDLQSAIRQQDAERGRALLQRAITETDQLLHSVHEVATRVRPSVLDDLGLHDAVEALVSEIRHRNQDLAITTRLDFLEQSVSPKIGENVFRILQEGLMNIVRHANAAYASVTIRTESDELHVVLEDSGSGFDLRQRNMTRLGIPGMRERTELLGGRFQLTSEPGAGTRIEVSIPLQPPDSQTPPTGTNH